MRPTADVGTCNKEAVEMPGPKVELFRADFREWPRRDRAPDAGASHVYRPRDNGLGSAANDIAD